MNKKTPEEWGKNPKYSNIEIIDYDGWDRSNFNESWNEEISENEFQRRIALCTCIFHHENEMEICVSCGKETNVLKNQHIDLRKYYVEGVGQLCKECYKKIYSKEFTNLNFK